MEFVRGDRRARAVIVGLGLGIIGAGAMVPLGPVYADVVLGGPAQFGVLMTALGTGAAIGVVTLLMVQRRVRREPVFEMGVIGVGVFLLAAATFSSGGLVALMVAGLGACAGAAYVTGFTILQEHVSDELRGRTFATLAAVVRLCLLLALTVSPLLADVADWLAGLLIPNQQISVGALNYVFPGVRFALWIGGVLVIVGGLYARLELTRLGREEASQIHPTRPMERSLWSPLLDSVAAYEQDASSQGAPSQGANEAGSGLLPGEENETRE
jgi:dTMP kinase